ncbi:MAG TPA: adenosylcobinamide-GDP ribazoletransferase [Mycobacteriales bacterium]|nr:adenosylcobinamide-GDP ribazoletransferase [Mycobacteriales bacterium]
MAEGLRTALGLLTVLPVRPPARPRPRAAMTWAPAVGLLLGGLAAGAHAVVAAGARGPLLPAVGAVAALAALTRGLHLDGLADLADGLGSARLPAQALAVMKRSDIGSFGVVTLVLVLVTQIAALASTPDAERSVVVAAVAGRVALPWACRRGVPGARAEGLGALVAGTVPVPVAAGVSAAAVLVAGAVLPVWRGPVAVLAALAAAWLLRRLAARRLGGITGDVLGALVETATTVALVVTALLPAAALPLAALPLAALPLAAAR